MPSPMATISTLMAMCSLVAVFHLHHRMRRGISGTSAGQVAAHIPDELAYYHWMS